MRANIDSAIYIYQANSSLRRVVKPAHFATRIEVGEPNRLAQSEISKRISTPWAYFYTGNFYEFAVKLVLDRRSEAASNWNEQLLSIKPQKEWQR